MNRLQFRAGLAIAFLLSSAFYLWTADAFSEPWTKRHGTAFFAQLADAFLHRQTSLMVQPRPEMFTLRNPYDPSENDPYRLHDASFYRGRYYLYWGVSPTLIWYLPVRVLTGRDAADTGACCIFAIAGLLFYLLLLDEIQRDYFRESGAMIAMLLALLVAFGSMAPFVLRRAAMYESSILCGDMLTGAFLYFVYKALFRGALRKTYFFTSAVILALVFLSRPNLVACALVLAAGVFLLQRRGGSRLGRAAAIAFVPLIIAIAAQAEYNFTRFDSPLEYGLKYQLGGHRMPSPDFSIRRIPFAAFYYLFSIPKFSPFFPFLQASADPRSQPSKSIGEMLDQHRTVFQGIEPVAGILITVPLLLLAGFATFFLRDRSVALELKVFLAAVTAAALIVFAFDLCVYGPTMRYEVDSLPSMLLAVAALAQWIESRRVVFRAVLPVFVLYSVVVSAAMSVSGYDDHLLRYHPDQFNALTRFFGPLERLWGPQAKEFGAVRAKITWPRCDSDVGEPLVVTGIPSEGDVFSVHCAAGPSQFVIVWDHHWVNDQKRGSVFTVQADKPALIEIDTPALYPRLEGQADAIFFPGAWERISKSCTVRVNGREVFRQDGCEMDPSTAKATYLFANGIGIPGCARRYSGDVLSVERIWPRQTVSQ